MLSFPHLVVLFVIALIIFGPQKLPELARMLGKATAEFRKMTNDFRFALEDEVRELERQTRIREEEKAAAFIGSKMSKPVVAYVAEGLAGLPVFQGNVGEIDLGFEDFTARACERFARDRVIVVDPLEFADGCRRVSEDHVAVG